MQVFVPYQNPFDCAQALDPRRFNKQILECKQIRKTIRGESTAWVNHPCVLTYRRHTNWLRCYLNAFECFKAFLDLSNEDLDEAAECFMLAQEWGKKAMIHRPPFLTDIFCNQHRRRLYTKDPQYYSLWADLGPSDENWYFVDGEIIKYKNGRRIDG